MPTQRKKIAVIGDSMIDEWIHGKLLPSQDGVQKFVESERVRTPGGSANAARQLQHWDVETYLIAPWHAWHNHHGFNTELVFPQQHIPVKTRYIDENGRIVFRHDSERIKHTTPELNRELAIKAVKTMGFDGVLISDYDKGFLDFTTIQAIIKECNEQGIPIVCDAKRNPAYYVGAILKCNEDYAEANRNNYYWDKFEIKVITRGSKVPVIRGNKITGDFVELKKLPQCVNHVGAGDCFAAHLVNCLVKNYTLLQAVRAAHSAGRVYVQHPHNRPPWPHELFKDALGIKSTPGESLRQSLEGKRIIFTNGVFRIPHAGHSWLLQWAKSQGDVLVVGVNDDESAKALRPGEFVLPLQERIEVLSAMECVDWIIPFSEPDPYEVIKQLKPDYLVKGSEYVGQKVPGDDLVKILFAPESPFPAHASDIVAALRV